MRCYLPLCRSDPWQLLPSDRVQVLQLPLFSVASQMPSAGECLYTLHGACGFSRYYAFIPSVAKGFCCLMFSLEFCTADCAVDDLIVGACFCARGSYNVLLYSFTRCVTFCRDHNAGSEYYGRCLSITEMVAASVTSPVLNVSGFSTGGIDCCSMSQIVAKCRNRLSSGRAADRASKCFDSCFDTGGFSCDLSFIPGVPLCGNYPAVFSDLCCAPERSLNLPRRHCRSSRRCCLLLYRSDF